MWTEIEQGAKPADISLTVIAYPVERMKGLANWLCEPDSSIIFEIVVCFLLRVTNFVTVKPFL